MESRLTVKYRLISFLVILSALSQAFQANAQQAIGSACPTVGWTTIQPNQIVYCNTNNVWALGEEISSTGSVGIGTTNPQYATLTLNGNLSVGNGLATSGYLLDVDQASYSSGFRVSVGNNNSSAVLFEADQWGGGNRFTILGSGNVGIGSTSPAASLDLSQKTDALALPSGTTAQRPGTPVNGMLRYNSTTTPTLEAYVNGAWSSLGGGGGSTITLGTSAAVTNPQRTGDATTGLFSPSASTVAVATAGSERVRIDNSGFVGIGTATPVVRLHVVAPNSTYGTTVAIDTGGTGQQAFTSYYEQGSQYWQLGKNVDQSLLIYDAKANRTDFQIYSSGNMSLMGAGGNVGIGSTAPIASLDLSQKTDALALPSGTTSQRPGSPVNGMLRYSATAAGIEAYINGAWQQFVLQTAGSTANVTASGPPVNGNIYTASSVTCNYTPSYGSCQNVDDGLWPANGGTASNAATCMDFPGNTSDSIVFDLGSVKTIANVYISSSDTGPWFTAGVSFSTDAVSYSMSATIAPPDNNFSTQYYTSHLNPAITARYVRIMNLASNASTGNNAICQFAVGP